MQLALVIVLCSVPVFYVVSGHAPPENTSFMHDCVTQYDCVTQLYMTKGILGVLLTELVIRTIVEERQCACSCMDQDATVCAWLIHPCLSC